MRVLLWLMLVVVMKSGYANSDTSAVATPATEPANEPATEIRSWLDQCWDYRFSDPDSAKLFGYKALKASQQSGKKLLEAEALHNISVVFEAQGEYEQALEFAKKAMDIRRGLGDEAGMADSYNNIGIIYEQMGNFTHALESYQEAYERYKRAGDPEKLALVSVNLGILFKTQGSYTRVVEYYREAYAVYQRLGKMEEAAFCEANLGSVFYSMKQYDSCLHYSTLAERTFLTYNNLQFLPVVRANAGMAYFESGRQGEAKKLLLQALEGHRAYNNQKETAAVLIELARVYAWENNYEKAIGALTETKDIAGRIQAPQQVMDAAKLMSDYYASLGDYRNAWSEHLNYSTIKDSLFEAEKVKTIAGYQAQFETEKKEQRITVLRQETAIQQLQLKQRNILVGVLLLLITAGGIVTYFILNRRKLRAEARLQAERSRQEQEAARAVLDAEERERRRLASDLHDGVGQMLSAALMNLNHAHEVAPSGEETRRQLTGKALSLLNDGYDEMRSLSHRMMPRALLRAGLPVALEEMLSRLNGPGLAVSFEASGLAERLPEQTETVLYRVAQEAVNNVIKHAGASRLTVQLTRDEEGVALNIEDDGRGFDTGSSKYSEGIGMKNIVSRLALLNGTAEIHSAPGKGTLVAVFVAVKN